MDKRPAPSTSDLEAPAAKYARIEAAPPTTAPKSTVASSSDPGSPLSSSRDIARSAVQEVHAMAVPAWQKKGPGEMTYAERIEEITMQATGPIFDFSLYDLATWQLIKEFDDNGLDAEDSDAVRRAASVARRGINTMMDDMASNTTLTSSYATKKSAFKTMTGILFWVVADPGTVARQLQQEKQATLRDWGELEEAGLVASEKTWDGMLSVLFEEKLTRDEWIRLANDDDGEIMQRIDHTAWEGKQKKMFGCLQEISGTLAEYVRVPRSAGWDESSDEDGDEDDDDDSGEDYGDSDEEGL